MNVGIDAGRSFAKIMSDKHKILFEAAIGEWRERKLTNEASKEKYDVSINGKKYFVASLAAESPFRRRMGVSSKVTEETQVLILTAAALVAQPGTNLKVVTGVPIDQHTVEVKQQLTALIKGHHDMIVSGRKVNFAISEVAFVAEGCAAYWDLVLDNKGQPANPKLTKGKVRMIDIGSRTINIGTIVDQKYLALESETVPFGLVKLLGEQPNPSEDDKQACVKYLQAKLGWMEDNDAQLIFTGGGASALEKQIKAMFPSAIIPKEPAFSNARGLFKMGQFKWPGK